MKRKSIEVESLTFTPDANEAKAEVSVFVAPHWVNFKNVTVWIENGQLAVALADEDDVEIDELLRDEITQAVAVACSHVAYLAADVTIAQ